MESDLYAEFLDLPPGPRPPNHYAILLLPLFESDPARIHEASLSQNAKLRRWQLHRDRQTADRVQEMLNELGRAAFVLEDPARKAEYDRSLPLELGDSFPDAPGPVPAPPPLPPEPSAPPARPGPPPPTPEPPARPVEVVELAPMPPEPPAPPDRIEPPPEPPARHVQVVALVPMPPEPLAAPARPAPRPVTSPGRCPGCNAPIRSRDTFCTACGENLRAEEEPAGAGRPRRRRGPAAFAWAAVLGAAAVVALLLYFEFRPTQKRTPPSTTQAIKPETPTQPPPKAPERPVVNEPPKEVPPPRNSEPPIKIAEPKHTTPPVDIERQKLDAALTALRTATAAATARDRFGEALDLVEAFQKTNPSGPAAAEAAKAKEDVLAAAQSEYAKAAREAAVASAKGDFASARAAVRRVLDFGVPALADRARDKLRDIDDRETRSFKQKQESAAWAKWTECSSLADRLAAEGRYDEALQALDGAAALSLPGIATTIATRKKRIEASRRTDAGSAARAYETASETVWARLEKRDYDGATQLLAECQAKPEYRLASDRLKADLDAALLIQKEFWPAVEQNLAARKGTFVTAGTARGTVVRVEEDEFILKDLKGVEVRRPIRQLDALPAVASSRLKDDPHASLVKGVFLLAERALWPASKALDLAEPTAGLPIYLGRLTRLREDAAEKTWRPLQAKYAGGQGKEWASEVLPRLKGYEDEFGSTKFAASVRFEISSLRQRAQARPVDDLLKPPKPTRCSYCSGTGRIWVRVTHEEGMNVVTESESRRCPRCYGAGH